MTALTTRTWRLDLPYERPPLNANDRAHHMAVWRAKRTLTDQVRLLARHEKIPRLQRIHVELHYIPAVARTRDSENLMATMKPAIDGLRDFGPAYKGDRLIRAAWTGIIADDDNDHVTWSPPVIHDVTPNRRGQRSPDRVWLIITEVAT